MEETVPIIQTFIARRSRLGIIGRATALGVAMACLAVLLVAVRLSPSTNGFGTHEELGLQPCGFLQQTGLPCPTCGMTTSFAHFVRLQIAASLFVQPAGTVLALGTAMAFWAGLYIGVSGRPAHRLLRFIPARYYLTPLFALIILGWIWKIWIHLRGMDGWMG